MIYRERSDATLINALSNVAENQAGLSRYGKDFDWTQALQHVAALTNGEDAFMVFEETEPRIWQCTTIFGPTCRGKKALSTGLQMKEYMRPYADTIFGSVPDDLRNAAWFYRKMGGKPVETVETEGFTYTANDGETLYRMDM